MATFLEVLSINNNKHCISISSIHSISATAAGCNIKFGKEDGVATKTPYKVMKAAIEDAAKSQSQIYTTISEDINDTSPRGSIVVS